jgi:hypothetical protein
MQLYETHASVEGDWAEQSTKPVCNFVEQFGRGRSTYELDLVQSSKKRMISRKSQE